MVKKEAVAEKKKANATIRVNLEKECRKCHKKGALENGLCMTCTADKISTMRLSNWPDDGEDFRAAPEVDEIAGYLIAEFPELTFLADASIYYQFQEEMSGLTIGNCTRTPKKFRSLIVFHFVITIDWTAWREMGYLKERRRLVYHELKHIGKNEDGAWTCEKHDFEGFVSEWILFQDVIKKDTALGRIFLQTELELTPAVK